MYSLKKVISDFRKSEYSKYYFEYRNLIKPEHFFHPKGIHGVLHSKRVLLINLILAFYNNLSEDDVDILCTAAVYHDIGRNHDGSCIEHGIFSMEKIKLLKLLDIYEEDFEILKFIIENHCKSDFKSKACINNIEDKNRCIILYDIFKDSDGLDRVRIKDLNPLYLRNSFSKKLVNIVQEIYGLGKDFEKRLKLI